jgi:uncharacterized membrane protein YgdD (TMEM256/DUF423 family)
MNTLVAVAAVLGFLGVLLGAFGAHVLRARLGPERLAQWSTGTLYHLLHVAAMLAAVLLAPRVGTAAAVWAGWLFASGIVAFSGSLYGLATTGIRRLGAITPVGGALFLAGWAVLAAGALR